MFPLDWQLNTIVDGQFTVEEDRLVVAKLGEAAVDAKIQSLKEQRAMCIFFKKGHIFHMQMIANVCCECSILYEV